MRVTAISDVQRRSNGLRVSGLISSGGGMAATMSYQNRAYAGGDLGFRCNVDYRGQVTDVRIGRINGISQPIETGGASLQPRRPSSSFMMKLKGRAYFADATAHRDQ